MTILGARRAACALRWAMGAAAATLAACGGGGGSSTPPSPPTATLSASAKDVPANGQVTLTWSSMNASGCNASGGWNGSLAPSGSKAVAVPSTATFTITCTGGGGSANASASVTAWSAPAPKISADTTSLLANNTVQLTWSSTNATACTGADALSGPLATSGSMTSANLAATTVFSVACTNPAFPTAVKASVTVNVATTFTAVITVNFQAPGAPVLNASNFNVPDWAHPVTSPVPYVWVEMQDPTSKVVGTAYADANGMASIAGLNPTVVYTPVIRSRMSDPALGLDFVVLNNTAPVDTSQALYRKRYAAYANAGPAYTPDKRSGTQTLGTLTATDGWDSAQNALVDAKRFAGPYALLANAVREAQIVSAAIGGTPTWRPLTILWSVKNKGGLAAPPNQIDAGYVTGSGGYYNSGHKGVDASGTETGDGVTEDFEFISGDQTTEPMDIYPWVLTHEMGHFTQNLFSTIETPGGAHSYSDYEDPTLAWVEGNASGIAALVLNTPAQNRIVMSSGTLVVSIYNPVTLTVNGNKQSWPVGWFQETTTTRLMWELYDPNGTVALPAAAVLAPMYTAAWHNGPWLNTPWAYAVQLAKGNAKSSMIDALADSLNIKASGDDEWGASETNPGNRTAKDALAPYTTVTIGGGPVQICSAGAAENYNKESNVRYVRVTGDNKSHVLTIQGPAGTVPILGRSGFSAGSNTLSTSATFPTGYVVFDIGDCSVADSPFSSTNAECNEPAAPPVEQCWTVTVQ